MTLLVKLPDIFSDKLANVAATFHISCEMSGKCQGNVTRNVMVTFWVRYGGLFLWMVV